MANDPAMLGITKAHLHQVAGDRARHLLPALAAIRRTQDQAVRADAEQVAPRPRHADQRGGKSSIDLLRRRAKGIDNRGWSRLDSSNQHHSGKDRDDRRQGSTQQPWQLSMPPQTEHLKVSANHYFYPQPHRGTLPRFRPSSECVPAASKTLFSASGHEPSSYPDAVTRSALGDSRDDCLGFHLALGKWRIDKLVATFQGIVDQGVHALVEVIDDVLHVIRNVLVVQLHTAEEHRTIQSIALVPGVVQTDPKGVLVEVVGAFAIHVTLARLERGFDDPHPVQLPALALRIGMVGQKLLILLAIEVELVGVIGDVHLLTPYQFVIEAFLTAGKHLQFVEQGYAALAGHGCIEGKLRGQFDPALPWRVTEGAARLGQWIEVVAQHNHFTGTTCRAVIAREHPGIHQGIAVSLIDLVIRHLFEGGLLGSLGHLAVAIDDPAIGGRGGGVTGTDLVAQLLVPDHLVTGFRDRERQTAAANWIDRQAIFLDNALGSITYCRIDPSPWGKSKGW